MISRTCPPYTPLSRWPSALRRRTLSSGVLGSHFRTSGFLLCYAAWVVTQRTDYCLDRCIPVQVHTPSKADLPWRWLLARACKGLRRSSSPCLPNRAHLLRNAASHHRRRGVHGQAKHLKPPARTNESNPRDHPRGTVSPLRLLS